MKSEELTNLFTHILEQKLSEFTVQITLLMEHKIDEVNQKINNMDSKISSINDKINHIEERLDKLEEKVTILEKEANVSSSNNFPIEKSSEKSELINIGNFSFSTLQKNSNNSKKNDSHEEIIHNKGKNIKKRKS